jgi:hypothetical protein
MLQCKVPGVVRLFRGRSAGACLAGPIHTCSQAAPGQGRVAGGGSAERIQGMPENSTDIIQKWANQETALTGAEILEVLWTLSKDPSSGEWNVGAQTLAARLRQYAIPGQHITVAYVDGFRKKCVNDLCNDLGW